MGLYCDLDSGTCQTCKVDDCPEKEALPNEPTYKHGEYDYPNLCAPLHVPCNKNTNVCRGTKCTKEEGGEVVRNLLCKNSGNCTDDTDTCPKYGCLNGKVVYTEGQECYSTNNTANRSCTDGTFCHEYLNTYYRSTAKPKVIYNRANHEGCYNDFDCDLGHYCAPYRNSVDGKGKCLSCLVDNGCPEKGSPNFPTCKYGDNNCPNKCAKKNDNCGGDKDLSCCLGIKCSAGKCINDNCKNNGTCTDDDNICPYYGCLNGEVVFAAGQKCNTKGGGEDPNCKVRTGCHDYVRVCYYKRSS